MWGWERSKEKKATPSIAILPFENKGAPEDAFYAYGIVADLISDVTGAGLIRVAGLKDVEKIDHTNLSYDEMSKILLVTLILPLIVLPNIILLHLISLLSASIFFATNDIVPFGWVWSAYSFTDWFRIIFSLWAQSLWSLPLTAWLMFAGAFARRPIMGALVPIAVVVVLEGIVLKTNYIFTFIEDRLGFWTRASSFPKQSEELRVVDVSDIYLMLSTQDFWIGMALSTLLIAGIVYFRSRNNDYSSE